MSSALGTSAAATAAAADLIAELASPDSLMLHSSRLSSSMQGVAELQQLAADAQRMVAESDLHLQLGQQLLLAHSAAAAAPGSGVSPFAEVDVSMALGGLPTLSAQQQQRQQQQRGASRQLFQQPELPAGLYGSSHRTGWAGATTPLSAAAEAPTAQSAAGPRVMGQQLPPLPAAPALLARACVPAAAAAPGGVPATAAAAAADVGGSLMRDAGVAAGRAGSADLALLKRLLDPVSRRQQQQHNQQQQQQHWEGLGQLPELHELQFPLQQAAPVVVAQQQQQQHVGQPSLLLQSAAAGGQHGSSSSSLGMARSASLLLPTRGLQ
jgi:hypothetical protein